MTAWFLSDEEKREEEEGEKEEKRKKQSAIPGVIRELDHMARVAQRLDCAYSRHYDY